MQDILKILFGLAALVAILDYFGIKPKQRAEGVKMTLSRKWKLVIMLALVGVSLALSGYSFYRARHPKIVEKIVEKPVDKIVERIVDKPVPVPCPKPKQSKPTRVDVQPGAHVEDIANAPNSMAAGINTGTMMQGDVSPQFSKSRLQSNEPKNGMFETRIIVQVTTNHTFAMQVVATGRYIANLMVMPDATGLAVVTGQMSNHSCPN